MPHHYARIAFTPAVCSVQAARGSRESYVRMESTPNDVNHRLTTRESDFIRARNSFYMATVSETGWPYLQHRGGPAGFMKVLDDESLAFADFRGNRQYVSLGNLLKNDRVSLMFMDYPTQRRLKVLGRARQVNAEEAELLESLVVPGYRARVEHGLVITVEGFDWNCPQHILPRLELEEVNALVAPLQARIAELEAQLAC